MSLNIEHHKTGNIGVIRLSGRITLGDGTGELREAVKEAIAGGAQRLILDLKGVSYMDSAGLGELVGCRASVTNAGGELKLSGLQRKITDLMTVTKLHTVFEVHDSEEAALRSFGEDRPASNA